MICDERLTFAQLTDEEQVRVKAYQDQHGLEVLEMVRQDGKVVPTLINGARVDRAVWQEVVRIGGRSCTGTIVGKNAAITAAHCGRNNSRSVLEIYQSDGSLVTVNYRMIHHPSWRNQSNWDLAILVLEQEVDVKPARVGIDYSFTTGADVDLLGYGCVRPGGGGGNDGILRFGESKVQGFTGTDVITHWRVGNGGALCFGDSGGPMMKDGSNAGGQRTLIAVNSKGNIRDTNYNMRLDLDNVASWLQQIADQYDLEIIGVNSDGEEPAPDPDPAPTDLNPVWLEAAKVARQTAVKMATHYEQIADQYEAKISSDQSGGTTDIANDSFGL